MQRSRVQRSAPQSNAMQRGPPGGMRWHRDVAESDRTLRRHCSQVIHSSASCTLFVRPHSQTDRAPYGHGFMAYWKFSLAAERN